MYQSLVAEKTVWNSGPTSLRLLYKIGALHHPGPFALNAKP